VSTAQTLFGILGALVLATIVVLLLRRQEPFFDVRDEFEKPEPAERGPSKREIEYDRRATELDDRLARKELSDAEHADERAALATRFDRNEPLG
jgi:hypothetical protein